VIQVEHHGPENRDRQQHTTIGSEHDHRQVREHLVDDDLGPVKPEIPDPVELLDAVVQLVELPEPRNVVQQPVDVPLDEILDHQHDQELGPQRQIGEQSQRFGNRPTGPPEHPVERRHEMAAAEREKQPEVVAVEDEPEVVLNVHGHQADRGQERWPGQGSRAGVAPRLSGH
jgi:hypothetical protein